MTDDMLPDRCVAISTRRNTRPCEAFWLPYGFSAVYCHALVIEPAPEMLADPHAILYLCEAITMRDAWRCNCAKTPRPHDLEVGAPATQNGCPYVAAMAES